jgi:hypothetical protein
MSASAAAPSGGGQAAAWSWGASIVPCWRLAPVALCGLAGITELVAHGEGVSAPESHGTFSAVLGGRAAVEIGLSRRWLLEARADAVTPLVRNELVLNDRVLWESPILAGAFGIAAMIRMW